MRHMYYTLGKLQYIKDMLMQIHPLKVIILTEKLGLDLQATINRNQSKELSCIVQGSLM